MLEVLAVLTLAELQRFVFAPRYHGHETTFSVFAIVAISSYIKLQFLLCAAGFRGRFDS